MIEDLGEFRVTERLTELAPLMFGVGTAVVYRRKQSRWEVLPEIF